MEPEGSLPHPQVPVTCPYPKPARSRPYSPTTHFLKINLNIILPSTTGSPKGFLSFRLHHQNPMYASPLPHTCHMPHPSDSSRFYHPEKMGEQHRPLSSSLRSFIQYLGTSSLLGPNILLDTLFLNTLSLRCSLNVNDKVSHPHKTTGKNYISLHLK